MTTAIPCGVCRTDQTTDHAVLCWPCTNQLAGTLRGIPGLLALLDDRIAGLDRIDPGTGGYTSDDARTLDHRYPGTTAITALPYDTAASDAAASIRGAIDHTVHRLARHFRATAITVPHLRYLIAHLPDLRHIEWAPNAHADITRAVRRGETLTDTPAPVDTLGTCDTEVPDPEHGGIVLCGHTLTARPGDLATRCRGCGTTHQTADRRDRMLAAAADMTVTATDAARALGVQPATVWQWRRRGHITPVQVNAKGQPLYRLGDVRDHHRRETYGQSLQVSGLSG